MLSRRLLIIVFFISLLFLCLLYFALKPDTGSQSPLSETKLSENIVVDREIDFTYPNNWRSPELTHSSFEMQSGDTPCALESNDYTYLSPLPIISQYAEETSVVMINESHSKSLHRLFIRDVVRELTEKGYDHYGSELFGKDKTAWLNSEIGLKGSGYLSPEISSLSYWSDPVFGQVTEELARLEISFFSFEGDIVNIPPGAKSSTVYRDKLQAENIASYRANYPLDKIVVHTGYHHIKEFDDSIYGPWMGEQFIEMTGINPLTISQTECYGVGYFDEGHMGYAILADSKGVPISKNGYDLILVSAKEEYFKERPIWLRDEMDRKFVPIPENLVPDDTKDFFLITAREVTRPLTAPLEDIIYRVPFSDKVLALRSGNYEIFAIDRNKTVVASTKIIVE